MKSERRHELQHNFLLDWLLKTHAEIKPYLNAILLGVVLLLVCVLAYTWMSGNSAEQEALAWNSVYAAMAERDTARLDETVDLYPGTSASYWAAVIAGDMRLSAGCEQLYTTKLQAADELQKAQVSYGRVLESCKEPALRERATFGLARTYEAMAGTSQSQSDLKNAMDEYTKVVTEWPDGAYAKVAQERLDDLNRDSTKAFFDSLAAWEPPSPISTFDGSNPPFDMSGGGLDVGGQPSSNILSDITERLDETLKGTGGDDSTDAGTEPADGEETEIEIDIPAIPAMPAATGDAPAEGTSSDEPASEPAPEGKTASEESGE